MEDIFVSEMVVHFEDWHPAHPNAENTDADRTPGRLAVPTEYATVGSGLSLLLSHSIHPSHCNIGGQKYPRSGIVHGKSSCAHLC